ncbi:MAG: nuclear transport factor 2 family protein [Planctomycetes bacterium]|nr:nuclear transport factor 2 family protein [Planctomycetota bacterium]
MRKLPIFLLAALLFDLAGAALPAQEKTIEKSREDLKAEYARRAKAEDENTRRVRKELDEQYLKLAEANQKRDLKAILALRTPDFSTKGPKGQSSNYKQMAEVSKKLVEAMRPPIQLQNTILELTLDQNEAKATVLQEFSRMQNMAGKIRKVETSAIQRETWVRTDEGWKLKFVDDVHDRRWLVDGTRVDPDRPYNPDDPPYKPRKEGQQGANR